jgi:guanylate kinase
MSPAEGVAGGLLVVVSGPSGSGKTTISRALCERLGGVLSVSVTTRPRSGSEVEGREYHFVTPQRFAELVESGSFLEHAEVFGAHRYGTLREPVERHLAEGRLVVLEIDVQGARQVRRAVPGAFMIFIMPPGGEELLRRLRARGRDDEQSIRRRIAESKREIEVARSGGTYDAEVVNEDLERAIREACTLVRRRREARVA